MTNNYIGVIIEESLRDKSVLKKVKIVKTKVSKVNEEDATPWIKQWTLHTVEIPENSADEIAQMLSKSLDSKPGGSWYADFKNDNVHYIIFLNKIFKVDILKREYDEVVKYGLSIGIPKKQLEF